MMHVRIAVCLLLLCLNVFCGETKLVTEEFTFTSTLDKTGPLLADAVYPEDAKLLPVMIVQHGYGGTRKDVTFSAKRMAQRGYFCVCIDTRGWGGSAGGHDDGGLEIMDIYDGLNAALQKYAGKADGSRVSIIGYSNGGANVFFSTARFPFLFRGSFAFFGIQDYGMWTKLHPGFGKAVIAAVGATPEAAPDRYAARNMIQAASNLRFTRFHTAWDEEEALCPIPMQEAFLKAALDATMPNFFAHLTKKTDKVRWHHGYNNGQLSPAEDIFMDDLEKNNAATPLMPNSGELTVIGFVVTPAFTVVLGSGEDAVAKLTWERKGKTTKLRLTPVTSKKEAKAVVTLHGDAKSAYEASADKQKQRFEKGAKVQIEGTLESAFEFKQK